MESPLDKYSYQARLLPALIIFAPLAFAFGVWSVNETSTWKLFIGLLASLGFGALLAQLGRDLGKRKEGWLFDSFGGKPSSKLLSHRLSSLNATTLKRYHAKLKDLLPELRLPDVEDEMRSPHEATQTYDSCVLFLREKTRERKDFPLVFAENVNYGFRRNLWAWKPFGILFSSVGTASSALYLLHYWRVESHELLFAGLSGAASCVLLALWVFAVKPSWVRVVAETYAERLIGSLDGM